jgi:hypothetical protein
VSSFKFKRYPVILIHTQLSTQTSTSSHLDSLSGTNAKVEISCDFRRLSYKDKIALKQLEWPESGIKHNQSINHPCNSPRWVLDSPFSVGSCQSFQIFLDSFETTRMAIIKFFSICHSSCFKAILSLYERRRKSQEISTYCKITFDLIWFIVFIATFSNISAISWRLVLVVAETGVPSHYWILYLVKIINVWIPEISI